MPDPLILLAAGASAASLALVVRMVVPPPRRLRGRVDPYLAPRLASIDRHIADGRFRAIFGPMLRDVANWVGSTLDRSGGQVTVLRLRQAGWFKGLDEEDTVASYRIRQIKDIAVFAGAAFGIGLVLSAGLPIRLTLIGLGFVVGMTRTRGAIDRAIDRRRETMKIEIYTVNQLLAMRVRAGGGVIQAVRATCERGHGDVILELEEALRLHRSGWRGADAFRRIAELTPEPFCSRTYRLLATAEERGADLGQALLSLSEDVRETRRESIKRAATKRRAAMLVPTVAVLAPVLILFVAAPLPYLITGWQ